jgi:hypothetical protein
LLLFCLLAASFDVSGKNFCPDQKFVWQKGQNAEKAKEHFKAGQALFGAGQFEKAAENSSRHTNKAIPIFVQYCRLL